MKTPQTWLGALLAIQMVLAGGLYARDRHRQMQQGQTVAILSFDRAQVDEMVVANSTDKVILKKIEDRWLLPEQGELPADSAKIDALLTKLQELRGNWPVATSSDSHKPLQVEDDQFVAKLELKAKDKELAALLLGSSPGLRKTHVRVPKDDKVYAAEVTTFDLTPNWEAWLDRSLLAVKTPLSISANDYTLRKSGASWVLDGADSQTVNAARAQELAALITDLQVEAPNPDLPSGPPSWSLTVQGEGQSQPWTYRFWKQGEQVVAQRSDRTKAFRIAPPTYQALQEWNRAKLTEPTPVATPSPSAAASASPAPLASPTP